MLKHKPLLNCKQLVYFLAYNSFRVPVTIFGHTARSGSTLLAQMLNRTKGTRSISEPWPLIYVRKGISFYVLHMIEVKPECYSLVCLVADCFDLPPENYQS